MADDSQRPYRTNEYSRTPAKNPASDPLAELARLIGQTDPFAEFGRKPQTAAPTQHRDEWAPQAYSAPSYEQPAASADLYSAAAQPGQNPGSRDYEATYYQDDAYSGAQVDYDDLPPSPERRRGAIVITACFTFAIVCTAGIYGYSALFRSSGSSPPPVIKAETAPTKIVPPSKSEPQSNKLIYDRVGERSSGEKVVSREEQPIDINNPTPASLFPNATGASQPSMTAKARLAAVDQPKKVHTIVIRPDPLPAAPEPAQPGPRAAANANPPSPTPTPTPRTSAPQRLASAPPVETANAEDAAPVARSSAPARSATPPPSRNAPLSLSPVAQTAAPADPVRTASAPTTRNIAPVANGGGQYAVQISSQRSEAEAEAAFRVLQAKYPQLNGRQPIIRRADLGAKGIYYRAMVGPFASSGEAAELCKDLKAAGGNCLIQKN